MLVALEDLISWTQNVLRGEANEARRLGKIVDARGLREVALDLVDREGVYDLATFCARYPEDSPLALELAFRVIRTSYLTAAVFPRFVGVDVDMSDQLLLVMGIVLDPWRFGGQLVTVNAVTDYAERMQKLGGRQAVCESLMRIVEARVSNLADVGYPSAKSLLFRHIGVVVALEAALVVFDDGNMRPEELAAIELLRNSRAWAFSRFLAKACYVDEGNNMAAASRVMQMLHEAVGIVVEEECQDIRPEPLARDLVKLFPGMQERSGVLACLAMVVAAGHGVTSNGEEFLHLMGEALEIPQETTCLIVERARQEQSPVEA